MRNPQSLPDSPATQPYNQGVVKPAFAMQQPMGFASPNNIQVGGTQQPAPESPTPGYGACPQQQTPTTTNMVNQSQPVTPTSPYGQDGLQQQNNQSQPVTPPMQFASPPGAQTAGNWSTPTNSNTSPTAPTPIENTTDDNFDFFGPPMGGTSPAGSGSSLADLRSSTGTGPDADNPYDGVVQGMGTLTVSPEQPSQQYQNYGMPQQQQQPNNGYNMGGAPTGFAQQNNSDGPQQQNAPYAAQPDPWGADPWAAPQQQQQSPQSQQGYQPYNQQQAAYSNDSNWNSFAQPSPPQQQQAAYPVQDVWGGAPNTNLPNLNHSPQPYGGSPYNANGYPALQQQGNPYEGNPYEGMYNQNALADQDSQEEDDEDAEPERPCADHKSSADVMREYGAGLKALRLLDETTKNYNEDDEGGRRSGGLRHAAKHEHAKHLKAKQIRKMKKMEYKNKKTEMLAESSRAVKNVRRGFDPELTADKCQLDFDRQRDAQSKALKLMSMF